MCNLLKCYMIGPTIRKLFFANHLSIKKDFKYNFFINNSYQSILASEGYVVINNIFPKNVICELTENYYKIKKLKDFKPTNYFINSVSFNSSEIRSQIYHAVNDMVKPYLANILKIQEIRFPISVGYCINPANSISGSRMHQDPSLVDETIGNSLVVWISLCDMDTKNGCFHAIPKSHLFGNTYRSNFNMKWAFESYIDIIDHYKIPIPTKAGDVVIFDPALIHGSSINTSNSDRIAIQMSAIPLEMKLINAVEHKTIFGKYAILYEIDEDYFTQEHVSKIPSQKYPIIDKKKINYYYTKSSFLNLLK